jgi:ABC-type nitrate/sulfonate/bicarbonate transport system substrate-binding protein
MSRARVLRIGITPLTDSAPLVAAHELGLFGRHGLLVQLSVEPSWANIRDKLAAGLLDAAHALAPLPLAATLGVGPLQRPMLTALSLGLGGNAITVAAPLFDELRRADPAAMEAPATRGRALARWLAARRKAGARPLRLATVFPVSMHAYELRYWLAANGIRPDRDVELPVVPPPRMVESLEVGAIDGFCVGEPWSAVAAQRGTGVVLLTKHDVWQNAPEKVLAVNASWAEANEEAHLALLCALLEAAHWCEQPGNRDALARLLAAGWVDAPESALRASLAADGFHRFARFAATFPWRSHAAWIVTQMLRWGQLEKAVDVREAAAAVVRGDLYREAARELGVPCPAEDEKIEGVHAAPWSAPREGGGTLELGPDRFVDGRRFDARDPAGYLAGFEIHALRVPLEELASAQR